MEINGISCTLNTVNSSKKQMTFKLRCQEECISHSDNCTDYVNSNISYSWPSRLFLLWGSMQTRRKVKGQKTATSQELCTSSRTYTIAHGADTRRKCVLRGNPYDFANSDESSDKPRITLAQEEKKKDDTNMMICTECHNHSVVNEGGCITCRECGWSKCDWDKQI